MPLFSLNSNYGIGVMGEPSIRFLDFLSRAGCKIWQLLPLGPTGYGDSPYQSFSAFAGNPYFLNPEWFFKKRWITSELLSRFEAPNVGKVDYADLYKTRKELLGEIFRDLKNIPPLTNRAILKAFAQRARRWKLQCGLFMNVRWKSREVLFP